MVIGLSVGAGFAGAFCGGFINVNAATAAPIITMTAITIPTMTLFLTIVGDLIKLVLKYDSMSVQNVLTRTT
jgi:hypothetical protein